MKQFLLGVVGTICFYYFFHDPLASDLRVVEIYETAKQEALKTDKPSWELEMACVSLWAGQQKMVEGRP
jgi:hypothetical protein